MTAIVISPRRPLFRMVIGTSIAGLAVAIPLFSQPFFNLQIAGAMVLAVAVLGLNMLLRFTGQISLGHSFFFAVGAYTTAVLVHTYHWDGLLTIPVAALITFALGFVFGVPALRLHGFFLALVTLGLAIVTSPLLKRFDSITGGSKGLSIPPLHAPSWTALADDQYLYYVMLIATGVTCWLVFNFGRSRWGRTMLIVKENEQVAQALGVHVGKAKTWVFAWSTMFAGIAGTLSANLYSYVSPDSYTAMTSIELIVGATIGGISSISGGIYGALFIKFVPFYSDEIHHALSGVIYGIGLIAVMLIAPGGLASIVGGVHKATHRVWHNVVNAMPSTGKGKKR